MEIPCCICQKIFTKKNGRIKQSIFNYCSRECYSKKIWVEYKRTCCVCGEESTVKVKKQNSEFKCSKCHLKEYYVNNRVKYLTRSKYQRQKLNPFPVIKHDGNISRDGYKRLTRRNSPYSNKKTGFIFEHVLIICEHLGRPLNKGESVHHKNGDRLDNRLENLELWNNGQPSGQRVIDKYKFYKEFISQYEKEIDKFYGSSSPSRI